MNDSFERNFPVPTSGFPAPTSDFHANMQAESEKANSKPIEVFLEEQNKLFEKIVTQFEVMKERAETQEFKTSSGKEAALSSVASFSKQVAEFSTRLDTLRKTDSKSNRYYFINGDGSCLELQIQSMMVSLDYF